MSDQAPNGREEGGPPEGRPPVRSSGTPVWKIAFGVLLGLVGFVVVVAVVGAIGQVSEEINAEKESRRPATVEITADLNVCWSATFVSDAGETNERGCGPRSMALPTGAPGAIVVKNPGGGGGTGPLLAVLKVGGREADRGRVDYGATGRDTVISVHR